MSERDYFQQAKALKERHQLQEAETLLKQALEVYPDDVKLLVESAIVHAELGNKNKAAQYMVSALQIQPANTAYHRFLSTYKI